MAAVPGGSGPRQGRLGVYRVHTGHVQGHRVKAGEHTHVGDDGRVVLRMAVAVGRHVDDQADVEAGPPVHHRLGIFGDLPVQIGDRLVPVHPDGVPGTDGDAPAAAHAPAVVDGGLAVRNGDAVVGADAGAGAAAHAVVLGHMGLPGVVLLHLTGTGTTSHTKVFEGTAKTGGFMSFKMVHRDDDIRVGNRCSDFRSLTIFSPDFYFPVLRPFKSVGNDYLALSGNRIETVFHSTLQMVYGVGPASGIKRVTICQERFGT